MNRYICIHGHFYQPPRENPWLEAIEIQDSAFPLHDWNERVTGECYAANSAARVLDGDGRIVDVVDNYARISFDFGPTILAWMRRAAPDIYRTIALFFYDGPISQGIAFEKLLTSGAAFASRLLAAISDGRDWDQLVHIATDGETYGHHQQHGDMALAFALRALEAAEGVELTNYAEYLERHPPEWEVEIWENSSWSCVHGVERWRSDCGCSSGGHPGWNQEWRAPLRQSLDWLRDRLAESYEAGAAGLLRDPWAARDDYVQVILDRSPERRGRFLAQHAVRELPPDQQVRLWQMLELQRHAMLMYTSCGWFFDELSGIETVQVIQYAARAVQLAGGLWQTGLRQEFVDRLAQARSNLPEQGDGRAVFETLVATAEIDLARLAGHYAVSSPFETYEEKDRIYSFSVAREDFRSWKSGHSTLAFGRVRVVSEVIQESRPFEFGLLHLGDYDVTGGLRRQVGGDLESAVQTGREAFERGELAAVVSLLGEHFGEQPFSLRSLFRDEKRKVISMILEARLAELENVFRRLYLDQVPLMKFLADQNVPLPRVLSNIAGFHLRRELLAMFAGRTFEIEAAEALVDEIRRRDLKLDGVLSHEVEGHIDRLAARLRSEPPALDQIHQLRRVIELAGRLELPIGLWRTQNICFEMRGRRLPELEARAAAGDEESARWAEGFRELGVRLNFKMD